MDICIFTSEMEVYRDLIHDQVTALGDPSVLDIEWKKPSGNVPPDEGQWTYKEVVVGEKAQLIGPPSGG